MGNNINLIEKCILSCLFQDYGNYEIIVSDHSPTNFVKDLIKKLNTDKIKYYRYYENIGLPAYNTNNAIRLSLGDYIKIMNQDDYFYNGDTLTKMVNKINNNNWVLSGFIHYDTESKNYYNRMTPKIEGDGKHLLNGINTIGCPSVGMFPKDNFFDTNVEYMIDCELWYHLFKKYGYPEIVDDSNIVIVTGNHNLTSQLIDVSKEMIKKDKIYCYKKYKL
jgi:glycosyltransferase involved in cell wall biosynthesis